ncbi:endonuclease SmrB [Glaciecola sp. 2405UD65-10]|uniref:endonuclease SmrB n=1 Tax=Glaciecola sp. 2405UD65-10 TaxID=3397244 RepID=UPI003B5CFA57
MNKKTDEDSGFAALFKDAKPVVYDKYIPTRKEKHLTKLQKSDSPNNSKRQQLASVALSDEYQAHWPHNKPLSYLKNNEAESKDALKKLKMGHIPPDIEIDLHGLSSRQAKEEIIAVIFEAKQRHYPCVNIIHGHGSGVLKQKIPNWLVQHQDVIGFIQAPKAFGGKAGLLVLINVDFIEHKL